MGAIPRQARFNTQALWIWGAALLGALALNLLIFGLMPGLVQKVPKAPDKTDALSQMNVIRVQRIEPPPKPKEKPPEKPPKPMQQQTERRQPKPLQTNIPIKPRLNFEINPRLPAAPMDLAMPPLEQFAMDSPGLKNLYNLSDLDASLTALVRVPPVYPMRARRLGVEGAVTVEFTVNKQGLVQDIAIVEATPESIFDNAVMTCVSRWKFKAPTVEGIPVAARVKTTIKFALGDE